MPVARLVADGVRLLLAGCFLCMALACSAREDAVAVLPATGSIQVAFPPWDDAEALLIGALNLARSQVLVQAFLLTNQKITASLLAAHQRGVDVKVLADARQHADNAGSLLGLLADAGIPVWLETKYRSAHNKVMLIDVLTSNPVVVSGSFNFTWSAQYRNAENLMIMRGNAALAKQFLHNWERHQSQASVFTGR